MYSLISQSGHVSYGIKEYVCDTLADLNLLPVDGKAGSSAYIIEDDATYTLNHKGEWKAKKSSNNNENENKELKAEIEKLQLQVKALTDANSAFTAEIASLKEEIDKLEKEIEELTPKIEIVENTLSIPESIGTIDKDTNTLILSEENSEVVGKVLVLK